MKMRFHSHVNLTHFHMNGCAPGLALIEMLKATRKWAITYLLIFSYFPFDPPYVTAELREAGSFQNAMQKLKSEMDSLQTELQNSVPFFSSRYKVNLTVLQQEPCQERYQFICCVTFGQVTRNILMFQ